VSTSKGRRGEGMEMGIERREEGREKGHPSTDGG